MKILISNDDGYLAPGINALAEQLAGIADIVVVEGGPTGVEERKVVALIAYLMRLGTDISKPTAPIVATPTAAATGGTP